MGVAILPSISIGFPPITNNPFGDTPILEKHPQNGYKMLQVTTTIHGWYSVHGDRLTGHHAYFHPHPGYPPKNGGNVFRDL